MLHVRMDSGVRCLNVSRVALLLPVKPVSFYRFEVFVRFRNKLQACFNRDYKPVYVCSCLLFSPHVINITHTCPLGYQFVQCRKNLGEGTSRDKGWYEDSDGAVFYPPGQRCRKVVCPSVLGKKNSEIAKDQRESLMVSTGQAL